MPSQGVIRVYAQQTAVVVERRVSGEQVVQEGDILFVLTNERASISKGDTQTAVSQAVSTRIDRYRAELAQQQTQTQQQTAAVQKKLAQLRDQLVQIESEISLQQKRLGLAEAALKRFDDLRKSNFISEAQLQERQAELIDQQTRLRTLERTKSAFRLDISAAENELGDLPLRAKREASAIQRAISELEQQLVESEARRQTVVRAPQSGIVSAITAEPGQTVSSNQALASIVPLHAELEAELYAPTRSIGFIKTGTEVFLRYQAFPYQRFGQYRGIVKEISTSPLQPNDAPMLVARDQNTNEPLYRIRVKLDSQTVQAYGKPTPLRPGMQLEAGLALERQQLYEWVLEPLYSVTGRL
ncbi:MAG: HlyD family efflux transporter periplasmic adaptor subunit [Betaproteobacteria bacterium]|nr:HlyD family efflux transporter periplasmic adaptor subunit [Betaproteobacteria bacterium]